MQDTNFMFEWFAGASAVAIGAVAMVALRRRAARLDELDRFAESAGMLRAHHQGLGAARPVPESEVPRDLYSFELVRAPRHKVHDATVGEVGGRAVLAVTIERIAPGAGGPVSVYAAELAREAPHVALCPVGLVAAFRQTEWEPITGDPDDRLQRAFCLFGPDRARTAAFLGPALRSLVLQRPDWGYEFFYRRAILVSPRKLRGNDARFATMLIARIGEVAAG
jgi:hypothetical protein